MKRYLSFVRPLDFAVLFAVLLLALLCLLLPLSGEENGAYLSVRIGSEEQCYSLAENRTITLTNNGYTLTVTVRDGSAFVSETDCPARICLHMSPISHSGESILCAKAEICLAVCGGEGGYDGITG